MNIPSSLISAIGYFLAAVFLFSILFTALLVWIGETKQRRIRIENAKLNYARLEELKRLAFDENKHIIRRLKEQDARDADIFDQVQEARRDFE